MHLPPRRQHRKGIDCSAFVQRTFRGQFGLELPRSTTRQQETGGKSISRAQLRTGDLVPVSRRLYRPPCPGIYLGNNQFVHASTSSGVTISSMDEPYWKKRYNEARRVLKPLVNCPPPPPVILGWLRDKTLPQAVFFLPRFSTSRKISYVF
ncbi:NlpC/P60 family protein [Klebsiella pneumoniae]|nr:NlpC/P60 family protein [Klebsiella pneumoniae]